MSTKTTFKRIALVAVAALGLGTLTATSSFAAASTGFSLDKSSITVVGTSTPTAIFKFSVANAAATAQAIQSGESLTVTVVGVPTGVTAKTVAANAADLDFSELVISGGTAGEPYSGTTADTASGVTATDGVFTGSNTASSDGAATSAKTNTYYLGVAPGNGKSVLDQGTYTLRFRLTDSNGLLVQDSTAKVTFVTNAADSGASLALAKLGTFQAGSAVVYTTTRYIKATLTDANGGQVINSNETAPTLVADVIDADGAIVSAETLTAADAGGSTADFGYSSTAVKISKNGVYGISWTPSAASTTNTIRVRYGAASATSAVTVYAATTGNTGNSSATVTGTGLVEGTGGAWTAPLSMTSAKYTATIKDSAGAAVQDYPVAVTVVWAGNNAGDVTPVSGSTGTQVIKTDSSGKVSITLTNSAPITGSTATISVTGSGATVTDQVITWKKSAPVLAGVLVSPNANYTAALKSTNTVTFTFLDEFGAPVVGDLIALSIAGANNALSTVTIPSVKTDAKGQVSYTWTDAAALTTETDAITATSTTVSSATATRTVTYKTTVPVIATLSGKFDRTVDSSLAYPDVVPTTTIYTTNTGTGKLEINTAKNTAKSLASTASPADQVAFQYTAKDSAGALVSGVPVTVSISDGGHILGADGKPVSSRIIYPAAGLVEFVVTATTVGTKTITVTAGAVSATASVAFKNVATDARVLSAVADTAGLVTATVKDAFGNPVAGVALTGTLTAGAEFGNRSNSISVTTATDGTVSFTVLGSGTLTLATSSGYGATSFLAGYSDAVGATVQTGAPAGVGSVTLAVTGVAANDVAQAATDAAAEATDAANAATDAANAAAEAADAATAAAQDSADAVAALSTQVSEMISALKKQITALTNLVIKIQKKVKA